MLIEEAIKLFVTQAPAVAVLLWIVYRQETLIKAVLAVCLRHWEDLKNETPDSIGLE